MWYKKVVLLVVCALVLVTAALPQPACAQCKNDPDGWIGFARGLGFVVTTTLFQGITEVTVIIDATTDLSKMSELLGAEATDISSARTAFENNGFKTSRLTNGRDGFYASVKDSNHLPCPPNLPTGEGSSLAASSGSTSTMNFQNSTVAVIVVVGLGLLFLVIALFNRNRMVPI